MKSLLLTSLFCIAFLAGSVQAKTCSDCALPTLKNEVASSKAVFSGRVIKIEQDGDTKIITFQAIRVWKGKIKRTTKLYIPETMRYGIFYEAAKSYLVFASEDNKGRLSERRCSNSKSLVNAAYDMNLLGKGKRVK